VKWKPCNPANFAHTWNKIKTMQAQPEIADEIKNSMFRNVHIAESST
jgi:hypothetical protein